MQRNYLRGLLICLIPCLLAAVFAVRLDKYRRGIDLAGGTILVYEINLERTELRKKAFGEQPAPGSRTKRSGSSKAGLSSDEMNELAAQIKKRIDPTDIRNITVRPSGDSRLEIILPLSGGQGSGKSDLSSEDIEEVKRRISQMGVLEFRIIANGPDDADGINAAREKINSLREKAPTDMRLRAERGLAPDGPEGEFEVDIGETRAKVHYDWAEMGPEERESLKINNALAGSGGLWDLLSKNRNQTVMLDNNNFATNDISNCRMLVFSREHVNRDDLAREDTELSRLQREGKSEEEIKQLVNPKKVEYFVLTRESPEDSLRVGGDVTLTATSGTRNLNPIIEFTFNGAGAQQFGKITRRNKVANNRTRFLAVLLDQKVVSMATIQSEITTTGQITGTFTRKYVDRVVQILRSGALSAELRDKPVSENTIGPTLGADTIRRGTTAVGLAFVAILAFMVVYYRFAGVVACIALFANLLLTVGFMVAVNAAFTLPGMAGLVLTLGMAVDANVLIYERLREERNKGANLITAIRNGYDRAFPTIIDTHLTSIFTAIVLYTLGNDNLKGFAISLTVGLVISLFTSLYMTRLIFDFWQHRRWLTELKMLRLFERPNFHPMKYRNLFFTITGVLTVLGLALFLHRGENSLNVDFRGGTVFTGQLKPGEERALTTTADGKPGFRELLDEDNQRKRLDAVKAVWENKPTEGSAATVNTFVYTITYGDGATAAVTLSHKPDGNTDEEMAANVLARAKQLPDASVEQVFLAEDPSFPDNKSRLFNVRTTEKQPELVRAALNRLMRDKDGTPILFGAVMSFAETKLKVKGADGKEGEATVPLTHWLKLNAASYDTLRAAKVPAEVLDKIASMKDKEFSPQSFGERLAKLLSADELKAHQEPITKSAEAKDLPAVELVFTLPTSRTFVQELLDREFRTALRQDVSQEQFLLTGLDEPEDGRFRRMKLDVSRNAAFDELVSATPDPVKKGQQLVLLDLLIKNTVAAFNATPAPLRLEVFDSQLATETRTKALFAIIASWLAILLYLWFRFMNWTFGAAAVICLIHDLCFTLGAIAACHYLHAIPGFEWLGIQDFKIDLASVAALLTLVGYSVSDTIVVFDRIREVRGKNPKLTPQMINDSVNQTLSRTMLTAATVFLVSFVLYAAGGEGVHLFAFVMVMGVLVGTYSSVFVAAPLLLIFGEGHDEPHPGEIEAQSATSSEEAGEQVVEG
jgi:SecD/SecF fusion protein